MITANQAVLADLRRDLKKQFATAHLPAAPRETFLCGVEWIDAVRPQSQPGGLPTGAICELCSSPAAGAAVIGQMLRHVLRNGQRLVLIDGADSFDPSAFPLFTRPETASLAEGSFLWARCRSAVEAVKVADLILRDGNLPRVILDLQGCAEKEIRAIPSSSWLRLRGLAEESGVSCLAMTPRPLLTCAALRFEAEASFTLDDLDSPESFWSKRLGGKITRIHRPGC